MLVNDLLSHGVITFFEPPKPRKIYDRWQGGPEKYTTFENWGQKNIWTRIFNIRPYCKNDGVRIFYIRRGPYVLHSNHIWKSESLKGRM